MYNAVLEINVDGVEVFVFADDFVAVVAGELVTLRVELFFSRLLVTILRAMVFSAPRSVHCMELNLAGFAIPTKNHMIYLVIVTVNPEWYAVDN